MRLVLARLALLFESIVAGALPAFGVVGAFLLLAFFGGFAPLPFALHLFVLTGFAAALGLALWRGFRGVRFPGMAAAERRLEQASGLAHQPLAAAADQLAGNAGDPLTEALWAAHRRRMAEKSRALRFFRPRIGQARRDPYALRWALMMLLLVAAADAGDAWPGRLAEALGPARHLPPPVPAALDIWITRPAYTGLAPVFLKKDAAEEVLTIPAGSTLLAQLHGGKGVPVLKFGGTASAFTPVDGENFRLSLPLATGDSLAVSQDGGIIGEWRLRLLPDLPPRIAFARPPSATEQGALRLDYTAADDYGVTGIKAVIRRADQAAPDDKIELSLPVASGQDGSGTGFQDLTAHPWAGLPVSITLTAKDAAGQTGESAPQATILPERVFRHPVARALIEIRKELGAAPDRRGDIVQRLTDIANRPERFGDDSTVFLALRVAGDRLILDPTSEAAGEVRDLLWQTGLRIEEGRAALARRDLRELQEKLRDALANHAPPEEIDRLMEELRQAMDAYMKSMAEKSEAEKSGTETADQEQEAADAGNVLTPQDLDRLLDEARDLARTGSSDAANALLSELQNLLENLKTAPPPDAKAGKALGQLHDLMQQQQLLLEQSFRGESGTAAAQEALRRQLGKMELGETVQPSLDRAGDAMREAAEPLKRAAPKEAIEPQSAALGQLQEAAKALEARIARQSGGKSPGHAPNRDPLGRLGQGQGGIEAGTQPIPEAADIQRSRLILDELRRRSGERFRPEYERDYIERLLKRF